MGTLIALSGIQTILQEGFIFEIDFLTQNDTFAVATIGLCPSDRKQCTITILHSDGSGMTKVASLEVGCREILTLLHNNHDITWDQLTEGAKRIPLLQRKGHVFAIQWPLSADERKYLIVWSGTILADNAHDMKVANDQLDRRRQHADIVRSKLLVKVRAMIATYQEKRKKKE